MKTNQLMKRRMGNIDVTQRTKDGFFCASELLKQWNEGNNHKKNVNHYLENSKTKEFIKALINDDDQIRNSEKPKPIRRRKETSGIVRAGKKSRRPYQRGLHQELRPNDNLSEKRLPAQVHAGCILITQNC